MRYRESESDDIASFSRGQSARAKSMPEAEGVLVYASVDVIYSSEQLLDAIGRRKLQNVHSKRLERQLDHSQSATAVKSYMPLSRLTIQP